MQSKREIMQVLQIDNLLIHYRCAVAHADAPWIVFINSLGTDARIWDGVIEQIAGRFNILSYDKRGHGLSDIGNPPYSLEDHIDDLDALIAHLGVTRPILCGVSVGGMIAQGYYHRRAENVAGLILSNTSDKIGDANSWNERIANIKANGIAALAPTILRNWFSQKFHDEAGDVVAVYSNMLTRCPIEGYLGTCVALREADMRANTKTIAAPTIVIAGSNDMATPTAAVKSMAEKINDVEFVELNPAGHIPSIEAPDKIAAIICEFEERIRGRADE
jgi:3-oxoadipate enol-lactonase